MEEKTFEWEFEQEIEESKQACSRIARDLEAYLYKSAVTYIKRKHKIAELNVKYDEYCESDTEPIQLVVARQFIDSTCLLRHPYGEVYDEYVKWAYERDYEAIRKKDFGEMLRDKGYEIVPRNIDGRGVRVILKKSAKIKNNKK